MKYGPRITRLEVEAGALSFERLVERAAAELEAVGLDADEAQILARSTPWYRQGLLARLGGREPDATAYCPDWRVCSCFVCVDLRRGWSPPGACPRCASPDHGLPCPNDAALRLREGLMNMNEEG